jgi:TolA-binding protein
MMTSILIVLTGFGCMLVFYQAYALHFVRRRNIAQEETEQELQRRIQSLEQELRALCSASVGAGEHVVKLEQQVQRITERQDQIELRASSDRPYDQASQLVNKGADIEDLMESCGLTRGEAELLVMMQRGAA